MSSISQSVSIGFTSVLAACEANQHTIYVIDTWNATPHLETSAELIIELLKAGKTVKYAQLGSVIPIADCYSKHANEYADSIFSIISAYSGFTDISRSIASHLIHRSSCLPTHIPNNIAHLRTLKHLGVNIGIGIYSHLCSLERTVDPATLLLSTMLHGLFVNSIFGIYVAEFIKERDPASQIILFNGRLAFQWALYQKANSLNIPCLFHERGGDLDRYFIGHFLPHAYQPWFDAMKVIRSQEFSSSQREILRLEGHSWLNTKISRSDTNNINHGLNQRKGESIPFRSTTTLKISYFTSSMDEFKSLPDEIFPMSGWDSEYDIVVLIDSLIDRYSNVEFVVRLHPHLTSKPHVEQHMWNQQFFRNTHLIRPDSHIDSYELISSSDVVFTFGSTIGLEAIYLGKPVIVCGRTYHDHLPGFIRCYDRADVIRLISSFIIKGPPAPPLVDTSLILEYCGLRKTFGVPYKYYQASALNSGKFLGLASP